ncbi:MAG: hypothetical protein IKK59_05660 [Lachnospiraceae bacterium]|nr:hypothetical protein [Lachnospiraceae bacterium]
MKIAEWISNTYQRTTVYGTLIRPKVMCADGFKISVQASRMHYCTPRATLAEGADYKALELGFASHKDELIEDYCEGLIYPYVPVEFVDKLIEKHGGIMV